MPSPVENGLVKWITSTHLDPNTRTLRIRLRFSNPLGELKPNMFANVALEPVSSNEVLTIPRSSVIGQTDILALYLQRGGKVSLY